MKFSFSKSRMSIYFQLRDKELDFHDYRETRTLKLSCHVYGIDEDFFYSRTPRNVKYSIEAHEDSIGTALNNLYKVSLIIIEQALIDVDEAGMGCDSLDDVKWIYDIDDKYNKRTKIESRAQVELFFATKLMALQIGKSLNLSFQDVEVKFQIEKQK